MGGTRDPRLGEGQRCWTVESTFVFFFLVNLLNYVDRGGLWVLLRCVI